MGHTPYGYKIENGAAVIDETEADCVRQIFDNYISGMSLREAASAAGHPLVHSTVKRLLNRKCYCGDDFYPAIIDAAVFHRAKSELKQRADNKNQTGKTRRIIPKFITSQPDTITEFDETLVRHLLDRVTVFDQKLVFEFKSGVSVEIEK